MSTTLLPSRRTTAALLVVGGIAEVVEGFVSPLTDGSTTRTLSEIAAHEGRFVVSATFGLLATILYAPGFLGLAAACAQASPRLARFAGWISLASMGGFLAVRLIQGVQLAGVREGLPRAAFARAIDGGASNPIGATILVMFLVGAFVGLVLLAVLGWRAGLPRVACVLLGLFSVGDWVLPDRPLPFSHLLLLVALSWLGVALWSQDRRASSDSLAARTTSTATDESVIS